MPFSPTPSSMDVDGSDRQKMTAFSLRRLRGYVVVFLDILFQKLRALRLGDMSYVGDYFSVEGKTILITGPTSGIGKETAWALAKRRAHVILACRNLAKGDRLKIEFEQKAERLGLYKPSLEVAVLDMSDLQTVRSFASAWRSSKRPLDVLINNAGIFDMGATLKRDDAGMEQHMLTNYLGPFLLTLGLLPALQQDSRRSDQGSRIVNVVSVMHHVAELDPEDPFLLKRDAYTSDKAYGQSKLATILFGAELQRRLREEHRVAVCSAHPGEAVTDVVRGLPFILQWIYKHLMHFILFTSEQGARCSVYCATAREAVVESHRHLGYFGSNARPEKPSEDACSTELATKLWEWAAAMTQLPSEWNLPPRM